MLLKTTHPIYTKTFTFTPEESQEIPDTLTIDGKVCHLDLSSISDNKTKVQTTYEDILMEYYVDLKVPNDDTAQIAQTIDVDGVTYTLMTVDYTLLGEDDDQYLLGYYAHCYYASKEIIQHEDVTVTAKYLELLLSLL